MKETVHPMPNQSIAERLLDDQGEHLTEAGFALDRIRGRRAEAILAVAAVRRTYGASVPLDNLIEAVSGLDQDQRTIASELAEVATLAAELRELRLTARDQIKRRDGRERRRVQDRRRDRRAETLRFAREVADAIHDLRAEGVLA